jgi:hypothetical protein
MHEGLQRRSLPKSLPIFLFQASLSSLSSENGKLKESSIELMLIISHFRCLETLMKDSDQTSSIYQCRLRPHCVVIALASLAVSTSILKSSLISGPGGLCSTEHYHCRSGKVNYGLEGLQKFKVLSSANIWLLSNTVSKYLISLSRTFISMSQRMRGLAGQHPLLASKLLSTNSVLTCTKGKKRHLFLA